MNAIRFKELNGPDADPFKEPIDERAVLLAGHGSLHGRYQTFDKVIEHTTTLTRVKSVTGSQASMPPCPPRARPTHAMDLISFLSFSFFILSSHSYMCMLMRFTMSYLRRCKQPGKRLRKLGCSRCRIIISKCMKPSRRISLPIWRWVVVHPMYLPINFIVRVCPSWCMTYKLTCRRLVRQWRMVLQYPIQYRLRHHRLILHGRATPISSHNTPRGLRLVLHQNFTKSLYVHLDIYT